MKIQLSESEKTKISGYIKTNSPKLHLIDTRKINQMRFAIIEEENALHFVALNLNARWKFIYLWLSMSLSLSFFTIFTMIGDDNYLWIFIVFCFALLCTLVFMLFKYQQKKQVLKYIENYNAK